MKTIAIAISIAVAISVLMFAEYRYIMCEQRPYYGEDGTLYIEAFGQVDEYYAAPISEMYE